MADTRFAIAFRHAPNPTIKVWPYLQFWKFVSTLETQGLFFTRLDRLGDPWASGSESEPSKGCRWRDCGFITLSLLAWARRIDLHSSTSERLNASLDGIVIGLNRLRL